MKEWRGQFKAGINKLMARIFALWTLMNADFYE